MALKPSESARKAKRELTLTLPGIRELVIDGTTDIVVTSEYIGSAQAFPLLTALRPDLYRCFMEQTWNHSSHDGVVSLVHPESHFTDDKAQELREGTYLRLRRHWQFINELMLYEITHHKRYGIHVYGPTKNSVNFLMASSLYHPDTVERSLRHDASGEEPGIKDPDGNWDLRPHLRRITHVTDETLGVWHEAMEDNSVPVRQTRMVYTVNSTAAEVLKIVAWQKRIGSLAFEFSSGWNETTDRQRGYFELRWGIPASWEEVILQGPHLFVASPMYKSPNPTMKHNLDWSATDLEALPVDALPATSYKPTGGRSRYDAAYTQWKSGAARDYYRLAWRAMGALNGERTLFPAIIPPGAAHIHGVSSAGIPRGKDEILCLASGISSSLIADFAIRAVPKSAISMATINRLPVHSDHPMQGALVMRVLRLNCVTDAYADLWLEVYQDAFTSNQWAGGRSRSNRPELGAATRDWTAATPLRIAEDRRQALVEIDALVALMLGITSDQLCTIYRTQFAVLYGYDHYSYVYDMNGRLVPNEVLSVWRKKGDAITKEECTATNQAGNTYTYELPFTLLDREADMRTAYAEFERRLAAM